MNFEGYRMDDTVEAELVNTIILIDAEIGEMHLSATPEFHILGGTALIFHGLNYAVTLDIDTGNRISAGIRDAVDALINDNASEVCVRAANYQSRLIPYMAELEHIKVFIFSPEDLLISKCGTGRRKDIKDIINSGLRRMVDVRLLARIIVTELTEEERKLIRDDIEEVYECKKFLENFTRPVP